MEAARALSSPLAERRERRFARECEQLRPLGIAYVLRHFGHSLDRADAEDAVADVIFRLHRQQRDGRAPDNLRAAFFTGARNAAIDQLRSRAAKPTVALEAAAEAPLAGPTPLDRAEAGEDATRLREALARMRPNYREAIVLRFGLDLTVPEIAERLGLSLPAAKKLVLRATGQARERLQSIEGAEFCPQMREAAHRALLEREAAGLAEGAESAALRAHFEHCGPCRSFLASLHSGLHELGSTALLGGLAAERSGALPDLGHLLHRLADAGHAIAGRSRLALHKAAGAAAPDGPLPAPALAGAGQKLAAICTVGAAGAASCLASGVIGPGIGGLEAAGHPQPRPAHLGRQLEARPSAPAPSTAPTAVARSASTASVPPSPRAATPRAKASAVASATRPAAHPKPQARSSADAAASEFGFEAQPPASSAPSTSSSAASPAAASARAAPAPARSAASSSASDAGEEQFGFGG